MIDGSEVREMKIWKSNLQGFLEEAVDPVYVVGISERSTASIGSNGSMEMVTFAVCLTGLNEQKQPLELRIARPRVPVVFQEDVQREHEANLPCSRTFVPGFRHFAVNVETEW
jgi:hypothetical protein